jgi:predicted ATPase
VFDSILAVHQTRKRENGRGREKRVVSQDVLLAKLGDLVGHDRAKEWHPLLNPLLPFDFPETAETEVLSNTARLELSLDFFYEILANQKEPVLVCLEDAHWCDELSWALIKRCHNAPEALVVLTSRPEDGGEEKKGTLQEFVEEDGVQRMVLGALEEGALRQHIAALLEVEEISEQLLKLIESRTGGNLLYIQELVSERASEASAKKHGAWDVAPAMHPNLLVCSQVSSLIESGMLKYNDKSVDLKSNVDDLVVPDNVQAVIASRLAGLTTSQQSILQTASVIGRTFTLGMVTDVHPASEMLQTLSADLKEIVRKRLVERTVGSGGGDDADGELQLSHK